MEREEIALGFLLVGFLPIHLSLSLAPLQRDSLWFDVAIRSSQNYLLIGQKRRTKWNDFDYTMWTLVKGCGTRRYSYRMHIHVRGNCKGSGTRGMQVVNRSCIICSNSCKFTRGIRTGQWRERSPEEKLATIAVHMRRNERSGKYSKTNWCKFRCH